MQKLYSEVSWNIDVDKNLTASHTINLRVYNTSTALPSVQDRISIGLPRIGSFSKFATNIDGQSMIPGLGFSPQQNLYSITLDEVRKAASKVPTEVTLIFEQRGAIRKCSGLCFYELDFTPRLYQSSLELSVQLPIVRASLKNNLINILCRLTRASEVPQVQYLGIEPTQRTEDKGIFNFRDDFPQVGILFTPQYAIDKVALLGGFIGGVLISAIGGLIIWAVTM